MSFPYFTCHKCGNHHIEEVKIGVTTVTQIYLSPLDIKYGEIYVYDGIRTRFRCSNCGFTIRSTKTGKLILTDDELIKFLLGRENE